jgi:hypothetical protein
LAHFSISSAISLPPSVGEPGSVHAPISPSRALSFGSASPPLLRSANRAIGLGRACGHDRIAGPACPLERAMVVAVVPREDNAFANDNPPPARNAVLARYRQLRVPIGKRWGSRGMGLVAPRGGAAGWPAKRGPERASGGWPLPAISATMPLPWADQPAGQSGLPQHA